MRENNKMSENICDGEKFLNSKKNFNLISGKFLNLEKKSVKNLIWWKFFPKNSIKNLI